MREPFRTQFIGAIRSGAAAVDVQDGRSSETSVSLAFIERELDRPYAHQKNICAWIKHLTPNTIFDVGCGTGGLTVALAWTFPQASIEAFDADSKSVQAACLRLRAYGLRQVLTHYVPPAENFAHSEYDLVTCTSVLEFVPEEQRAIFVERLRSCVRPGGHLLITTSNPRCPIDVHSQRLFVKPTPKPLRRAWLLRALTEFTGRRAAGRTKKNTRAKETRVRTITSFWAGLDTGSPSEIEECFDRLGANEDRCFAKWKEAGE